MSIHWALGMLDQSNAYVRIVTVCMLDQSNTVCTWPQRIHDHFDGRLSTFLLWNKDMLIINA